MARLLLVFAALIGFVVGGSFVWSFEPPIQAAKTSATKSHSTHDSSQNEQTKSLRQGLSIIWDRTWDDPVAFYTFVLGIFTGLLAILALIQIGFLIRSDKTARITANAAQRSADAAIAIELPILQIEPLGLGYGSFEDANNPLKHHLFVGSLAVKNAGRTKAFPVDFQCGWTFGNELPSEPIYRYDASVALNTVIDPQSPDEVLFNLHDLEMTVPENAYEQLRTRTANFWFYVRFAYVDFMKTRHEVGFCWRRIETFGAGSFAADDTPAYNRKT